MPNSNAASFIGLGLTAAGLAFGLYQYRMNSQEAHQAQTERAVMAVKLLKEFYEDTNVTFAMQLLDHGRAKLAGIGEVAAADLPAALARHWVNSSDELKDDATRKSRFTVKDRAIRTAFDGFLVQLESIQTPYRQWRDRQPQLWGAFLVLADASGRHCRAMTISPTCPTTRAVRCSDVHTGLSVQWRCEPVCQVRSRRPGRDGRSLCAARGDENSA